MVNKRRKFKIGDIVEMNKHSTGKIIGLQDIGYFVKPISGTSLEEYGKRKKLTFYDSELKKKNLE